MRSGDKNTGGGSNKTPRRRRRGRKLLIALGVVVLLLGVLVALAPTIVSGVAPGIIEGRINAGIAGRAEVRGLTLSWTGPQRVGSVRLFDPEGGEAADVSVRTDAGLLALATGNLDLGEVVVAGWASAESGGGERTRIERATEASAPAPAGERDAGGGASIPASLKAVVKLDAFEVRTDAGRVVLDGEAGIAAGAPVTLTLGGKEDGREVLSLTATLTNLIGAGGAITIDAASVDAEGSVTQAPTALLDALAPLGVPLVELLGERADAAFNARGTMDALDASFSLESAGVSAMGGVRKTGEVVEQTGVISLRADGARVARAMPSLREALVESASIRVESWPEVTIIVEGLRAPLESIGKGDYRGLGARVLLTSTPTRALVPTGSDAGGQGELALSGLELTLDAPDLGGAVSVKGGATATLDGRDAGELTISLDAPTLLDAGGALLDPGSAAVSGGVTLAGVAAQTIQPFVEGTGLDIARDLGAQLTMRATAQRAGEDKNHITVSLDAPKATAELDADIEGQTIRGGDSPGVLTLLDPGPTIVGLLADSGVSLASAAGPYTITIQSLEIDLERLRAGEGLDLRAVHATASASIPGAAITVGEGDAARVLGVRGLNLRLDASDPAAGVRVSGGAAGVVDGSDGGTFTLDARLGALFDASGALAVADATLDSTLTLAGVPASMVQAFVPTESIVVREDVGETIDASVVVKRARGADAPIEIDLGAGGAQGRISGELAYSDAGVRTRGDGLLIEQNKIGRLVNRMSVLPMGARFERVESALGVRVTSLNVPRDAAGGLDIDAATVSARAEIAGGRGVLDDEGETFVLGPIAATLDRQGGAPATFTLTMESADLRAADGTGVVAGLRSTGSIGWGVLVAGEGGDATMDGALTLREGGAGAPAGGGERLGDVTINATAPIRRAGAVSARAKGDVKSLASVERAIGREGLLTGALGERASFEASWTGELAGGGGDNAEVAWEMSASVESPRLKTQGPVRASASGGMVRLLEPARASWTVDPQWATAMALGEGSQVRLDAPIAMNVRVDRFTAPTSGEGNLDVEAAFTSNAVVIALEDGTRVEYTGLDATAKTGENPEYVDVRATMLEKGAAADAPKAVEVVATLGGLGGPGDGVVATGYANLRNAPTSFIDAVAGMDGLLVSFLGDRSSAHVRANGLSRTSGTLTASAATSHATAAYEGRVVDGSLVSTKPTELTVNAITKDFGLKLVKVVPVFGSIIKNPETDRPARIVIDTLSVPVDGRDFLSNLDAVMQIDAGEARLTLDGGIGKFLNADQGIRIGNGTPPFPVNVNGGGVNYEGLTVPVGEFALNIGGKVDLVNKTQDVRVGVPAAALAAEAAGGEGALGRIFDQALGVSLVNKGPMGKSGWELKLGGGKKREPGDAIRDILKGIGG